MTYIWALDISLSNTGVCIFDGNENVIKLFSIPTNTSKILGERLKIIADTILFYKEKYSTKLIILENAFSRYNISTQMIYRTHGLINYIFWDCEQIYYPPSSIKKIVCGNGRADKKIVQKQVLKKYPDLQFKSNDESDACAIGICYFIQEKH